MNSWHDRTWKCQPKGDKVVKSTIINIPSMTYATLHRAALPAPDNILRAMGSERGSKRVDVRGGGVVVIHQVCRPALTVPSGVLIPGG